MVQMRQNEKIQADPFQYDENQYDEGQGVDLVKYALILWRRKQLVLGVSSLLFILLLVAIFQLVPRYTAEAMIHIGVPQAKVLNVDSVSQTPLMDSARIESEVQILQSRMIAERVVTKLDLMKDTLFNVALRNSEDDGLLDYVNPLYWLDHLRTIVFAESDQSGYIDENEAAEQERAAVVDLVVEAITPQQEGWSHIIKVRVETENPRTSMRVTNAVVDQYLVSQLEAKFGATERATLWLDERISGLRDRLEATERAVAEYRFRTGLTESSEDTTLAGQQIAQINTQLVVARLQTATARARVRQVEGRVETIGAAGSSESIESPQIQNMRTQVATLAQEQAELSLEYGMRHPRMIALQAEIESVRRQISEEVSVIVQGYRNDYEVAKTQENILELSLGELKGEIGTLNSDAVQLRTLEREAEAQQTLYRTFLNRFQETSVQEDLHQADAEVIAYAAQPKIASFPPKTRYLVLALLFSLGVGVSIAFIIDRWLDRGFSSLGQVEEALGLNGLITVPLQTDTRIRLLDEVVENPRSHFAELLRSLQSSIELSAIDDDSHVIMFSSSLPGEGKSTLSSSFARLMALSDRKVLLIDADLRRGTIHSSFDLKRSPGLVELLAEKASPSDFVHVDPKTGLHIITSGKHVISPQDVLGSNSMREFIDAMRQHYDLIVLDTPPSNVVSEARLLASMADRVVMIVKWSTTDRDLVKRSVLQMERAGARFAGAVLSQVDIKKQSSYGYNYRYSHYDYSYDTHYHDE